MGKRLPLKNPDDVVLTLPWQQIEKSWERWDERCPHYKMVPKDFDANLRFRKYLTIAASKDPKFAAQLRQMCAEDILFYINTFVWTYDPRKDKEGEFPIMPFITYPFQDEAVIEIDDAIGSHDLAIEKSRDMGATWCNLLVIDHRWHFRKMQSFMIVSRKEDLVDKPDDPDCLFWKLDFIREHQPVWLLPPGFDKRTDRSHLKLINRHNGSTIVGDSTTGDLGRGGRRTAIFLDEFASVENGHDVLRATRDNTNCRLYNSTPKGQANAFYDVIQKPEVRKLTFLWVKHPEKARGLYRTDRFGTIEILDEDYVFPDDYHFINDGKIRSPWYDLQCARAAHPQEIAQELDIDYQGSDFLFFHPPLLQRFQDRDKRPALFTGEVQYSLDTLKPHGFIANEGGRFKLWINPDLEGRVPEDRHYVVACDVALGTGASNSTMAIYDKDTQEQVAEFASPHVSPEEFAPIAVATCKWLNGAFLIWEGNGAGVVFGKRVIALGYRNIFYRRDELSITGGKVSMVPGFFHNNQNKLTNFIEFRRSMGSDMIVRSNETYQECKAYIHTQKGTVEHSKAHRSIDPTGARDNHGDLVVAHVLARRAMIEIPKPKKDPTPEKAPPNSFAARRHRRQLRAKSARSW